MPTRIAIRAIDLFERPVAFARPFRFGAVVVTAAPQVFVRVEIDVESRGASVGASAEMMPPKWFDKRPHLSLDDSIAELRQSLTIARDLYLQRNGFHTAFDYHATIIDAQVDACARSDIPALAAAFGPAEIDKAILDALLRKLGLSFFDGMTTNVAGLDARLASDIDKVDIDAFLSARKPIQCVAVRHTVGLDDAIEGPGGVADVRENAGSRYFKLKLRGDPDADCTRLIRISAALATLPHDWKATLDANEQYADIAALKELVARLERDQALAPIASRLLYIEQPMPREMTWAVPITGLSAHPVIIDEADDNWRAFPTAKAIGYRGISSKSCKGLYKAIVNAARAAAWSDQNNTFFITGEDLTCQAGLGVQQDLALGEFIGVTHAERNGHHYVDGFGKAPIAEAEAFLAAHPDLYHRAAQGIRLSICDGGLSTTSLHCAGFAAGAHPDWTALDPIHISTSKTLQEHSL